MLQSCGDGRRPKKLTEGAQAYYARVPTVAELVGTGYEPEDYETEAEIWPENWPIFCLFAQLSTQWRIGNSGPSGLDYAAMYPLLDREYQGEEWDLAFADIRLMESEALRTMRET